MTVSPEDEPGREGHDVRTVRIAEVSAADDRVPLAVRKAIAGYPGAPELENYLWLLVPLAAVDEVHFNPTDGRGVEEIIQVRVRSVPTELQVRRYGMQPWKAGWSEANRLVVLWIDEAVA